jgi:hypothetical protein
MVSPKRGHAPEDVTVSSLCECGGGGADDTNNYDKVVVTVG